MPVRRARNSSAAILIPMTLTVFGAALLLAPVIGILWRDGSSPTSSLLHGLLLLAPTVGCAFITRELVRRFGAAGLLLSFCALVGAAGAYVAAYDGIEWRIQDSRDIGLLTGLEGFGALMGLGAYGLALLGLLIGLESASENRVRRKAR